MTEKKRVAIVVSHPIQHFVHLYRALAKEAQIELLVIFASNIGVRSYYDKAMGVNITWKTDMLTGYRSKFLPEAENIDGSGFWSINNPSVTQALEEFRPQVVQLHGYAQLTLLRALFWCRRKGVPALLWSDSSLLYQRNFLKRQLKKIVVSLLMRQFKAVLTVGDNNEDYYRYYGVSAERMYRCPFTIDEERFGIARKNRQQLRKDLCSRYQVSEDAFLLLFVAKLIPRKRPQDLLEALLTLKDDPSLQHKKITAFIAGDGELKGELQNYTEIHGLSVIFGGFINVDLLPDIYAMADTLVFPSLREPYGLSAREAICVGLPVIVSDQIGCIGQGDAARPGSNAIIFPAGDSKYLAESIKKLALDVARFEAMSKESLRIADEMNVFSSTNGFLAAVRAVS